MKKTSSNFVCNSCGYESVQWYGKCPNCGTWNTMVEFRVDKGNKKNKMDKNKEETRPVKLSEVKISTTTRFSSGIEELDRVLGGPSTGSGQAGFVPGEVVLLAGEPGVGKSTLLLGLGQDKENKKEQKDKVSIEVIYISGEESPEQIKSRAQRLGVTGENMAILAETQVERIIEEVRNEGEKCDVSREVRVGSEEDSLAPTSHPRLTSQFPSSLLIIDSIQTLWSEDIEGAPGSISQVKYCTQKLIELAKKTGVSIILIGQINKEGEIAGPMMLNHMVDCVLFLEGERFADLRLLRGLKNRFGPTDETGVFKMTEKGMEEVKNPSELFFEGQGGLGGKEGQVGAVAICAMEGTRPILMEIQALVTKSSLAIPRRVASGVDYNRLVLLAAVLQKNLNLPLYDQDIFVKVGGGFKVNEPAADLGICLAIISSFKNRPIASKTVVFGEVGLLGEIRRVNGEEKRGKEAKKLGFAKIISSATAKNLREAVGATGTDK